MDQKTSFTVSETQETGFAARLSAKMKAQKCGQALMARFLGVAVAELNKWVKGRKYPARAYWERLINKGVATEAELKEWQPKRARASRRKLPRGSKVYGVRIQGRRETVTFYPLASMAALATP